jgi:hypothetical protein
LLRLRRNSYLNPLQLNLGVRLPRPSRRRLDQMFRFPGCARRYTGMLCMLALILVVAHTARAQGTASTSCPMIAGGGFIKVRRYDVVFSAQGNTAGSTLSGLVIVRTPTDSVGRRSLMDLWNHLPPGHWSGHGSGANVGPFMIVYEAATHTVWIDSSAVPLGKNSNVLLVDVDARGTFAAVGQARIEPRLPIAPGACTDAAAMQRYQETIDTLWARFQASPLIRSFVSP